MSQIPRYRRGVMVLVVVSLAVILVTPMTGQSGMVRLQRAIPFHNGIIVGYEKSTTVRSDGGQEWQPSQANHVFLTIKLEIRSPFQYVRGTFRELSLVDDTNRIYQYRGMLTAQGWVQFDDAVGVEQGAVLATIDSKTYPSYVDVHFEVPSTIDTLALQVGNVRQVLFSPPGQ